MSHVAKAIEKFGAGELDAFEVDRVVFRYSRVGKKLWVFCNDSQVESLAGFLAETPEIDWWERGSFRKR